ncbi:MAG: transposase [Clostridia bacterium]|nr:transposase [Clostridia bacterium]
MEKFNFRKNVRLYGANYNQAGEYFITICTENRKCMLSHIVGTGVLDGPQIKLTEYGKIADKYIKQINDFYDYISIENYIIMPNHIHLLITLKAYENGPSGTPVPTRQNSVISRLISTFKRFCNKEIGKNIWQYRSYDHIIRNKKDYDRHVKYIHENPLRWYYDELYSEE